MIAFTVPVTGSNTEKHKRGYQKLSFRGEQGVARASRLLVNGYGDMIILIKTAKKIIYAL